MYGVGIRDSLNNQAIHTRGFIRKKDDEIGWQRITRKRQTSQHRNQPTPKGWNTGEATRKFGWH